MVGGTDSHLTSVVTASIKYLYTNKSIFFIKASFLNSSDGISADM